MPATPPGARELPLSGIVSRITQAARYTINAVKPSSWFGPLQPLAPMAPQEEDQGVKGRRWDYQTGTNLQYVPRSTEGISFNDLRNLSSNCDILRAVIEARKDQLAGLDWIVRPRMAPAGGDPSIWHKQGAAAHPDLSDEIKDRIQAITHFFQYPDRENTFDQWQRLWLEETLVIDAPAMWRRRQRDGKLYSLEIIDGATIKPLIRNDGRRPEAPDPAYQQILHGVPAADFTSEELIYCPWNQRVNHLYGYSKVEQILITINTLIRRALFQLNYYTEGSQPDAFVGLPKEWNQQNIKDFQVYMDDLLSGNLAQRRKIRFVPGEFKYTETKPLPLKDTFDEFLARVICFTFGVAADPFIEHVSRGAVEKSHTRAMEEGLAPTQRYIKAVIDRIIMEDFKSPDLEFKYVEDLEHDQQKLMEIDTGYVKAGIFAIDEVRISRGKIPLGGPAEIPMLATASGYVPLAALTAPGIAQDIARGGGPAAQTLESRNSRHSGGRSGSRQRDVDTATTSPSPASVSKVHQLLKIIADEKETGKIPTSQSEPIDLPVATDSERAHLNHEAWKKIQRQGFKFVDRKIPISQMIATQSEVDKSRVEAEQKRFLNEGYEWPPVVMEMDGKYFILEGHHRTMGAKEAGATSLIVAILSDENAAGEGKPHDPVGDMVFQGPHVNFANLERELQSIGAQ